MSALEPLHVRDARIAQKSPNRVLDDESQRTLLHDAHSLTEFQLLVAQGLLVDLLDGAGRSPIQTVFGSDEDVNDDDDVFRSKPVSGRVVFGVGASSNFQLGNAQDTFAEHPRKAMGASDVVALATTSHHSFALNAKGHLLTCGSDRAGERTLVGFTLTPGLQQVRRIAVSQNHVVAVTGANRVFSWGSGPFGQLGLGDAAKSVSRPTPVAVNGLAVDVAVSDTHSVVATDSDIFGFGLNDRGQLGCAEKVIFTPHDLTSFKGQSACLIGANCRSTIVVFGPARGAPQAPSRAAPASFMSSSPDYDENGPRRGSGGGGAALAGGGSATRPRVKASDHQRIWVIGCDRLLPERLHLGVPFEDAPPAAKPAQSRTSSDGWQVKTAKVSTAAEERERATCSAIAVNNDLVCLVTTNGALYVAPSGPATLVRRVPVPLRIVDVALRERSICAVTDTQNAYEFAWSYEPCTAWAGRIARLPFAAVASLGVAPLHTIAACGSAKPQPIKVSVPESFGDLLGAANVCDLQLQAEDGDAIGVHTSVLTKACGYFNALMAFERTDAVRVDSSQTALRVCVAFLYDGGQLNQVIGTQTRPLRVASAVVDTDDETDETDDDAWSRQRRPAVRKLPRDAKAMLTVSLTDELLADLLQLADMWLLRDLSHMCVALIARQLSVANFADFCDLAETLTVDAAQPHPLLVKVAEFVRSNVSDVLSSAEFAGADERCVRALDTVLFGDRRTASAWASYTDAQVVRAHDTALARARAARQRKIKSLAVEHVTLLKLELSRRNLPVDLHDLDQPLKPAKPRAAKQTSPPPAKQAPPPVVQQPPPPAPTPQPAVRDDDSLLDNAVEEFLEREREAPPLKPIDIRAELESARAAASKNKMPRWRKTVRVAAPAATTAASPPAALAAPWRAVAASPSKSLATIQSEQLVSPDDDVFVPKAPLFSEVATGSSPARRPAAVASSPSSRSAASSSSSMQAIMEAEASASLAAQLQAEFDKEAAAEALRVAEAAEAEEIFLLQQQRQLQLQQQQQRRQAQPPRRGRGRGRGAATPPKRK